MEDKRPENARVACLSGILDLQRTCQKEKLQFSEETNQFLLYQTLKKVGPWVGQKLITKLVEKGQLFWDENEDYDVEQIVDHVFEDDEDFYLIKWKGWSRAHNSWEPKKNLNCPELVEEFHLLNYSSDKKAISFKRPAIWDAETEKTTKKRRLDELWAKLNKNGINGKITPLELLSASSPQKVKGLLALESKTTHQRKIRFRPAPDYTNKKRQVYKQKKTEVSNALKDWERKLNSICTDPASIVVENNVDLEGPPDNFEYINDYRPGEGIEIPQDPLVGCECSDCFHSKNTCCPTSCGTEFAYYKFKRVKVPQGTPIYECNKRCLCGPECPNRVVQQGRKCKVSIFRTANGRGWGVKTLQKMKKGTFVMEYVGEVITNEEAERRGKVYDAECRTYLFDLDYNDGDCPFTVDAGYYGNVSHFVNHSCEPNLVVYGVWINTLDPRLPRIALFSQRDIEKGEELTFDYMMTGDTTQKAKNASMENSGMEGSPKLSTDPRQTVSAPNSPLPKRSAVPAGVSSAPCSPARSSQGSAGVSTSLVPPDDLITPAKGNNSLFTPAKGSNSSPSSMFASPYRSSSGPRASQYRIVCQCGAENCRKYLF